MAKFCSQCGKPLAEGEICTCQQPQNTQENVQGQFNQAPQQNDQGQFSQQTQGSQGQNTQGQYGQQAQFNQGQYVNMDNIKEKGANIFSKILGMFKNPIQEIKNIADEDNMNTAMTFVIINIVAVFLVALIGMQVLKSSMGMFGDYLPIAKVVLIATIFVAAYDFALAGLMYFSTKVIFKEETTFQKMLAVVGGKVVLDTIVLIVSAIFMILSFALGATILSIGSIFTLIVFVMGYVEVSSLPKEKKCYALFIAMAIITLIILIIYAFIIKSAAAGVTSGISNSIFGSYY